MFRESKDDLWLADEFKYNSEMKNRAYRICHVTTVHPAEDVRVFYRECCTLVRAGYDVHLIAAGAKEEIRGGVHLHEMRSFRGRFRRMLWASCVSLIRALRIRADIYHYHDPELIWVGFLLRWVFRKKVIFDIHESVPNQILSKTYLAVWCRPKVARLYQLVERFFIKGQALIVANRNVIENYPSRAYLVQNYPVIDAEIKRLVEHSRKSDPALLVYVGGVSKIRGAEVYLQLAAGLAKRGCDFQMKIIGPCDEQSGGQMIDFIQEEDLANRVELIGRMDWHRAMEYVAQARIGMCLLLPVPNYTTCLATKIIEYMMLGTAVLASNFDCWKPYVTGERTGCMVDPTDIEQVVSVCEQMLNDYQELDAMGRRGAEAVQARYNWGFESEKLLECYAGLLNRHVS